MSEFRNLGAWGCRLALGSGCAMMATAFLYAQQGTIEESQEAVLHYNRSSDLRDAVSVLQRKIDAGKAKLAYDSKYGYLPAVLNEFGIPLNSQTLVFSKTSSQSPHTSPESPRALYYRDGVYVAFAHGDDLLDVISTDPVKGPIFFSLEQKPVSKPQFMRDETCMRCHFGPKTINVPGLLVRSVTAETDGTARSQSVNFISGHNNALKLRWGGWYVTGTHAGDVHMGNQFLAGKDLSKVDLKASSNITDLSSFLDTKQYLIGSSDTVALLVLDDVVRMQNQITRVQYSAQLMLAGQGAPKEGKEKWMKDQFTALADPMLYYMLFRDEAALNGPVKGTTNFQEEFEKLGPRDSKGRSLREFDLNKRLFRYPCNYMIYSPGFDAIPAPAKAVIWQRLYDILSGHDQSKLFSSMQAEDRKNVLEILLDTKPEFKDYCKSNKLFAS
jgi:hypothetical protein